MQPRLMRSRTEVILGGVCGGLGEYFAIDPVIVRLIFVLVTVTSGLGLLVYPILWLVMPKTPAPAQTPFPPPAPGVGMFGDASEQSVYVRQESRLRQPQVSTRVAEPPRYAEEPPPPSAYNFDPLTGRPLSGGAPSVGQTTQLPGDPNLAYPYAGQSPQPPYPTPAHRVRRGGRWLAFLLIGFGTLILADALGLEMDLVFPVLMIAAGLLLLRKRP